MLRELIKKLMALGGEEQESALAELTAFSGILKLDELLERQLKEFTMLDTDINLEENAVIRPLIEKGRLHGEQQGITKGIQQGRPICVTDRPLQPLASFCREMGNLLIRIQLGVVR